MDKSSQYSDLEEGTERSELVIFCLDDHRYALRLTEVQQVVRMVEITPLPQAPEVILGIINIRGLIVPVFHTRKRFHLPDREISLSDYMIIAQCSKRVVALVVDTVQGVRENPKKNLTSTEQIFPGLDYVEGVVKMEDGLIFIHDLDTFLSTNEEATLEQAIQAEGRRP